MRARTWLASLSTSVIILALAGCEPPTATTGPSFDVKPGATGKASGFGHFDAGVDVTFRFTVVQLGGFDGAGHLHFATVLGGEVIEFHGRATCLAIDPENRRAWIGGVITRNKSTHPSFTGAIHGVGRDIWFRVVDYGKNGVPQADRTTFVGFEGSAGIITSTEYCQVRPWPGPPTDPVDARTGPVTAGNIKIRVFD